LVRAQVVVRQKARAVSGAIAAAIAVNITAIPMTSPAVGAGAVAVAVRVAWTAAQRRRGSQWIIAEQAR